MCMAKVGGEGSGHGYVSHEYVPPALMVSARGRFRRHRPRVGGVMMKVALVQVGDDLGVAP